MPGNWISDCTHNIKKLPLVITISARDNGFPQPVAAVTGTEQASGPICPAEAALLLGVFTGMMVWNIHLNWWGRVSLMAVQDAFYL